MKHVTMKKRVISFLLIAFLGLSLTPAEMPAKAATPKVTGSITLVVGKSKTLEVTGDEIEEVTFSSTRKKVATVNKSGKVKALKYGTAIIKTKVDYGFETKTLKTVVTVVKKKKFTASKIYKKMIAKKKKYPEGKHWDNSNRYLWRNILPCDYEMYGCAAFACILSDAAFGKKTKAKEINNPSAARVRVGDILRLDGDSHSVIVLKVETDGFIVAEGNYNSSIHWGRKIGKNEHIDYLTTRYEG